MEPTRDDMISSALDMIERRAGKAKRDVENVQTLYKVGMAGTIDDLNNALMGVEAARSYLKPNVISLHEQRRATAINNILVDLGVIAGLVKEGEITEILNTFGTDSMVLMVTKLKELI